MNAPVTIGRRVFLGRTVAALAAATTANVTAIAATGSAPAVVAERPELVDAGRRLDALQAEWQAAQALRLEACTLAESLVPPVPDEILYRGAPMLGVDHQYDVEGRQKHGEYSIYNSKDLQKAIDDGRLYAPKRTKFGKKMQGIIEIAKKYEAERAAVIDQCEIDVHIERCNIAAMRIQEIAREVAEIEPLTMIGASVQAHALCAWAEAHDGYDKGWAQLVLGVPLARSIVRLSADSA
jgi:hypothetical protein